MYGLFLGVPSSCLLSSLNLLFPRIRDCYAGLLEVFRHVPPLSLIPLLILWFGIGELPKTIIIVLASFFPMYLNMDDGFRRCDRKLLEVGRMLGFSPWQSLWKIRLPSALPGILTGLRVGMGYSLRAIIGAEMIAADSGLGYLILDAQAMSRSDKVFIGIPDHRNPGAGAGRDLCPGGRRYSIGCAETGRHYQNLWHPDRAPGPVPDPPSPGMHCDPGKKAAAARPPCSGCWPAWKPRMAAL